MRWRARAWSGRQGLAQRGSGGAGGEQRDAQGQQRSPGRSPAAVAVRPGVGARPAGSAPAPTPRSARSRPAIPSPRRPGRLASRLTIDWSIAVGPGATSESRSSPSSAATSSRTSVGRRARRSSAAEEKARGSGAGALRPERLGPLSSWFSHTTLRSTSCDPRVFPPVRRGGGLGLRRGPSRSGACESVRRPPRDDGDVEPEPASASVRRRTMRYRATVPSHPVASAASAGARDGARRPPDGGRVRRLGPRNLARPTARDHPVGPAGHCRGARLDGDARRAPIRSGVVEEKVRHSGGAHHPRRASTRSSADSSSATWRRPARRSSCCTEWWTTVRSSRCCAAACTDAASAGSSR